MNEHEARFGVAELMGEFTGEIRAIGKGDLDASCNISKEYDRPCEGIGTILDFVRSTACYVTIRIALHARETRGLKHT